VRIWIDLANSPHVPLFAPIVKELRKRGHEPVLTARNFAQTLGLARLHGLHVEPIGEHGGRGLVGKARAILARACELRRAAIRLEADLSVSHNSYAQALAARSVGIRNITLMDYEHTPANHVSFRLAQRIILPSAIPLSAVRRYGATNAKVITYDGFKEQIYLDSFVPDRSTLEHRLPPSLWERHVVVVARPPADFAVYHRFHNPLFEIWLRRVGVDPGVRIVTIPRTSDQRRRIEALALPSVLVPADAVDGSNLIYHADLVVSAGGTMNREAAVLGVPVYSLFAGRPASVDQALERLGRLRSIQSESQLDEIVIGRLPRKEPLRSPNLCRTIVDALLR